MKTVNAMMSGAMQSSGGGASGFTLARRAMLKANFGRIVVTNDKRRRAGAELQPRDSQPTTKLDERPLRERRQRRRIDDARKRRLQIGVAWRRRRRPGLEISKRDFEGADHTRNLQDAPIYSRRPRLSRSPFDCRERRKTAAAPKS